MAGTYDIFHDEGKHHLNSFIRHTYVGIDDSSFGAWVLVAPSSCGRPWNFSTTLVFQVGQVNILHNTSEISPFNPA